MPNEKKSIGEVLEKMAKRQDDLHEYLNEIVAAQNELAVLVITIFQTFLVKGMVSLESFEKLFAENKSKTMNDEGECVNPVSSILYMDEKRNTDESGS